MGMKVKCPSCGKETTLDSSNKFRPFCSERCGTRDLAAWADEAYRVPVETQNQPVNEKSNPENEENIPEDLH
jgi:uncharacterized protein